jgi:hypothetical protein
MKKLIHPAYLEELRGELEEYPETTYQEDTDDNGTQARGGVRGTIWSRVRDIRCRSFVAGVGVGLVCAFPFLLPSGTQASNERLALPGLTVPSALNAAPLPTPTKLESEMELMKRIVAGLVESVQSLSKAREEHQVEEASNESFPFPVQVTAPKAHLRKGADLTAPSLLEVTKDTTLMAFAGTDKWLKVNTPRGEDAWISRSVVAEKRG